MVHGAAVGLELSGLQLLHRRRPEKVLQLEPLLHRKLVLVHAQPLAVDHAERVVHSAQERLDLVALEIGVDQQVLLREQAPLPELVAGQRGVFELGVAVVGDEALVEVRLDQHQQSPARVPDLADRDSVDVEPVAPVLG